MKSHRRLICLALTLALFFSVCIPSLAAETRLINIMVNGSYVGLPVNPAAVDGKVAVPAAAFASALGFDVSESNAGVNSVKISSGTVDAVITEGSNQLEYYIGGTTGKTEMDVTPYMQGGKLMAQLSSLCTLYGLPTGWLAEEKTVLITNPEPLLSSYKTDYTIMDKLLGLQYSSENTYNMAGDLSVKVSDVDGAYLPAPVEISCEVDMLQSALTVDGKIKVDMSSFISELAKDQEMNAEEKEMLDKLKVMDMEIIYDLENGVYYILAPALNELLTKSGVAEIKSGTWLKVDMNAMYSALPATVGYPTNLLTQLQSGDMTMYALMSSLYYSLGAAPQSKDTYKMYELLNDVMKEFLSDACFKASKIDGGETFEYRLDDDMLLGKLTKLALKYSDVFGLTPDGIESMKSSMLGADFELDLTAAVTIKDNGDYSSETKLKMKADIDGDTLDIDMDISSAVPGKSEGYIKASVGGIVMDFVIGIQTAASSKTVRTAPPEGAEIVDLFGLM